MGQTQGAASFGAYNENVNTLDSLTAARIPAVTKAGQIDSRLIVE
jgi:hypothetical protein